MDSREIYTAHVVRTAEARGWAWTYWQFDSDPIVYDMKKGRLCPAYPEASVDPLNPPLTPHSPATPSHITLTPVLTDSANTPALAATPPRSALLIFLYGRVPAPPPATATAASSCKASPMHIFNVGISGWRSHCRCQNATASCANRRPPAFDHSWRWHESTNGDMYFLKLKGESPHRRVMFHQVPAAGFRIHFRRAANPSSQSEPTLTA